MAFVGFIVGVAPLKQTCAAQEAEEYTLRLKGCFWFVREYVKGRGKRPTAVAEQSYSQRPLNGTLPTA